MVRKKLPLLGISQERVAQFRQSLLSVLGQLCGFQPQDYNLDIRQLEERTINMTAFIRFKDYTSAQKAVDQLDRMQMTTVSSSPIKASVDLKFSIPVPNTIYNLYGKEIEEEIKTLKQCKDIQGNIDAALRRGKDNLAFSS